MSIQGEISRIKANVARAYSAVSEMGGELPEQQTSTGLEAAIRSIPSGGEYRDHRQLSHRDAEEQHPIAAIAGLEEKLERIPEPVEALTNLELEEILK